MSDQNSPGGSGAGHWAERAKKAAQQRGHQHPAAVPTPPPVEDPKRRFFSKQDSRENAPSPSKVNPLLPTPGVIDDPSNEERGEGLAALGFGHVSGPAEPPVAPAPLNPAVAVPTTWPTAGSAPGSQGTVVQVVGLHGGAGTSTVAALLGPQASDRGHGLGNLAGIEAPVLFVARTHAHGLDLALRIGQQYAARGLDPVMVLGICLVRDAPTLSKGLARTLRSAEKSLPNCWTLPWDEGLRHDPALPQVASHGRIARDARRILKKATQLRESREPPHQVHNL